jgi:hypothetical protein
LRLAARSTRKEKGVDRHERICDATYYFFVDFFAVARGVNPS